MLSKLFKNLSRDIGIDLGTSNVRIFVKERGIVMQEPSVVAVNVRTDQILAVGRDAERMIGKTPPHIKAIAPLKDGIISDFEVTEKMLKHFLDRIRQENFSIAPRPRVVIGLPLEVTEVEKKAVEDAVLSAGAREVILVEKIMAAAVGARLPVHEAQSSMIIDLGGGTTEIAVIALNGVVTSKTLRLAGTELNLDIVQYARNEFNILIGETIAEKVKKKIGTAIRLDEDLEIKMRGRDLISGLPKEVTVRSVQIKEAISRSIRVIIDDIKALLEVTPPELSVDIYERGLVLTGGGAMLKGIEQAIAQAAQIPVQVADDPLTCVVRGAGIILEDTDSFRDIIVPSSHEDTVLR